MKNDFSKGSIPKLILSQAVPLTIAQLVQLLYNVIDRIYIGHLPASDGLALTGIGLTFPIVTLITAFTNLFGMGGVPLCSIARGENNSRKAQKIMNNTFMLLLYTSIVIMLLCYVVKRPLLYLFGASDATYGYANMYLTIYLIGTVFNMVGVGMNGFINCQGFPKMGMLTTVIGAILNIVLDPLFIFGMNMGVAGAAIATVISQVVSALWVMKFLSGKKSMLKFALADMKLELAMALEIVKLGLAGFIMAATNGVVQIVCNATLKIYGGDLYIGIMTVLNSVREILSLPVNGITNGAQPVLGYNYGAKENKRVKKGIVFTTIVGVAYTVFAWILIMIFPHGFIALFTNDSDMIRLGTDAIKMYFFGFFMMSLQFAGQSTFVALGKSRYAIFFSLLRKIFIVVPLTLLLPHIGGMGVIGVFMAEPISNAIGGLASYLTMHRTVWQELGETSAPNELNVSNESDNIIDTSR